MATQPSQKRAFDPPSIPDRLYFKIGDVARLCEVETYVLRFWETQFPQLKPNKSGTGQRLYRRRDVELALKIKQLVHGEGYTLAGARQALTQDYDRSGPRSVARQEPESRLPLLTAEQPETGALPENVAATIAQARSELREICSLLGTPDPQPRSRRVRVATMPPATGSLFPL